MKSILYTIGHSTRPVEKFLDLLEKHGIELLVDVRTMPRSRRNPQFNRETLPLELRKRGIGYAHMKDLGGLRKPRPDSPNMAWENSSFRGYADYMQEPGFWSAISKLLAKAERKKTAIMCAEAVPWRCHRSLVADALQAKRAEVRHITSGIRADKHRRTPFARVRGGRITYPPKRSKVPA